MASYHVPAFKGDGTRRPMARIIAELTGTAEVHSGPLEPADPGVARTNAGA